jgi:hypothetical protein
METVRKLPAYVRLIRLGYALLASSSSPASPPRCSSPGWGVFAGLENWIRHASFVRIFEWLPPLMLHASFVVAPGRAALATLRAVGTDRGAVPHRQPARDVVAALHPVGAL